MHMKSFEQRWKELHSRPTEPVFQRVDESHILDFYLGRDICGEPLLLLLTDSKPPTFPMIQSIKISSAIRQDGRWVLILKLVYPELLRVFSHLCEDLVESSRYCEDIANGASFVLYRFLRWKRLLERGKQATLDELALRGLIGELLFMEQMCVLGHGLRESLEAWVGPSGSDQDFRFSNFWYEVKTIRPGSSSIKISSIEQLDADSEGKLVIVILDTANKIEPDSFTVIELIGRLRQAFSFDPAISLKFEDKLLDVGYIEQSEYSDLFLY